MPRYFQRYITKRKNGQKYAYHLENDSHTYVFDFMMRICTGKRSVNEEDIVR